MKKILAIAAILFLCAHLSAQEVTGDWNGLLKVQGMQLRLVFHVAKTDSGYHSTMDSPDQGAKGIPVSVTSFENQVLKFTLPALKIDYEGKLNQDSVVGTFVQLGQSLPLNLFRKPVERQKFLRPQEPVKPYPYYSEDLTFENARDNISLAGTLTLPSKEGRFPAVVLITGSGPQNRDEELMGHKPFLVLADYLTRNGIAVLRFDDRGTFGSKGNFESATTLDFTSDVEAAVKYLQGRKEIRSEAIGLIGHSEGGIIAPIVAARHKEIRFIVLLAGTGLTGEKILLMQQELIGRASGKSEAELAEGKKIRQGAFDIVAASTQPDALKRDFTAYATQVLKEHPTMKPAGISDDDFIKLQLAQLTNPWMVSFIKYDPAPILQQVKCPVLALNGSKDLQVPPKENLSIIRESLEKGGNKNVTTKELPNLNHLFQECTTGAPSEYEKIEQTFSPMALNEVTKWILQQVGPRILR